MEFPSTANSVKEEKSLIKFSWKNAQLKLSICSLIKRQKGLLQNSFWINLPPTPSNKTFENTTKMNNRKAFYFPLFFCFYSHSYQEKVEMVGGVRKVNVFVLFFMMMP